MHIKGVSPEVDSVKMSGFGLDTRVRRQNPVSLRQRPPRLRLGSRIISSASKDQSVAADQAQTRHQKTKSWHGSGYVPTSLNYSEFGVDDVSTSCHKRANSNDSGNVSSNSEAIFNRPLIHHQRHNLKNRFQLLKTLGEGTYGKVKLAADCATGEHVAIKYIKKTKIHDEADLIRIRREIQILSSLKHNHIVNIREVFEKKDKIVLVMDYAQGGELYDYLNKASRLSETEARRIFRQIVSAIHHCHQNGIVHRDLKLENIILDDGGNVKIADFGLANYYSYEKTLETFCGSPLYASPEIVNGKFYHGPEVDVWSMGVILYTLVYGAMPFESNSLVSLKQQISQGNYAQPSQPSDAAGLIRHMLTVTPSRRASMEDALCHWWVNFGHSVMPNGAPYCPDSHGSSTSSPLTHKRRSNSNGNNITNASTTYSAAIPTISDITPSSIRPIHHSPSLSAPVVSTTSLTSDDVTTAAPPPPPQAPTPPQPAPQQTLTPKTIVHQRNQSSISSDSDLELDFKPIPWSKSAASNTNKNSSSCFSSTSQSPSTDGNSSSSSSSFACPSFTDDSNSITSFHKDNTPMTNNNLPTSNNEVPHQAVLEILKDCSSKTLACLLGTDKISSGFDLDIGSLPQQSLVSSATSTHSLPEKTRADNQTEIDSKVNNTSVFDSERKPKRSILKRRGKFSGGDSGCIMPEDMSYNVRPEDNSETNSVVPKSGNLPKRLPSFRGEAHGIFASKHRISQLLQGEDVELKQQQQQRGVDDNDKNSAISSLPPASPLSSQSVNGQTSAIQPHHQQPDNVNSQRPLQQEHSDQHKFYNYEPNSSSSSSSSFPRTTDDTGSQSPPPPPPLSPPLSSSSSSFTDSNETPSVPMMSSPITYHHHRYNSNNIRTRPTTNLLTTSSASAPCLNLLSQHHPHQPPCLTTTPTTSHRPINNESYNYNNNGVQNTSHCNPNHENANSTTNTIIVKDNIPTKVIRRPKSILKASRTSQLEEARNRLSISSIGSNSSADFLDLSYDSGDSDHFINLRSLSSPTTTDDNVNSEASPPDSVYGSDRASLCIDEDFDSSLKIIGFENGVENNCNSTTTTTTTTGYKDSPILEPRDQLEVVALEKAEVVQVIPKTSQAIFSEVESPMLYRLTREANDLTLH